MYTIDFLSEINNLIYIYICFMKIDGTIFITVISDKCYAS